MLAEFFKFVILNDYFFIQVYTHSFKQYILR